MRFIEARLCAICIVSRYNELVFAVQPDGASGNYHPRVVTMNVISLPGRNHEIVVSAVGEDLGARAVGVHGIRAADRGISHPADRAPDAAGRPGDRSPSV